MLFIVGNLRSIAYLFEAKGELKHMVVGVVSDVVTSFVISADQCGRMIECLANALGGKNDKRS